MLEAKETYAYAASSHEISIEQIKKAVQVIITQIEPITDLQQNALEVFKQGNYKEVKRLTLLSPLDKYIKTLSLLGEAFNPVNIN